MLAGQPKVVEADRDSNGEPLLETERTVEPGVAGRDILAEHGGQASQSA